jgi:hypothetical protein
MHIALVLFIVISIVHSIEALITCPTGSILYIDSGISKCYKFYLDQTSSWTNCYNTCTNTPGGSMLCPGTNALNQWISAYGGKPNKWIGYSATSACDQKGSYKWVNTCLSKPDNNYFNWADGEPNAGACSVYVWNRTGQQYKWDNTIDNSMDPNNQIYCGCEISPLTEAPTFSPSTVAPTFSPSTVAPTFSPSTVVPTTVPTTAVPSTLVPTSVELPECPHGWTLHCNCEWTSGPEKKNIEHGAVSVDTKAEVSSNDAGIGFNNQLIIGILIGAIGSLSMIVVLYLCTRSKKEIMHRSEYTPINDRESG